MIKNTKTLHPFRRAFTLVEMLIAMALTLILVYAIAEFYAYIGNAVRDGRATIEMGGQLRAATAQLNEDLQSLTLRPTPWIDPNSSPGYFTVYEGFASDADPDANGINTNSIFAATNQVPDLVANNNVTNLFGDGDDVIAMTIRAKDIPFQGTNNGNLVRSQFAEVIWYTTFNDTNGNNTWDLASANEMRFLCRRQLLIRPDLGTLATGNLSQMLNYWQTSEISARIVSQGGGNYSLIANSLADLSRRENRFACALRSNGTNVSIYPFGIDLVPNRWPVNPDFTNMTTPPFAAYALGGNSVGEDRVLANVLAFDVRVFDPGAPIVRDADSTTALVPGDPGFATAWQAHVAAPNSGVLQGHGAWVDLYYNLGITRDGGSAITQTSTLRPHFAAVPNNGFTYGVWDTWPTTYENQGTGPALNGLDDDGLNGVDDPGERQTQPPYAVPLRGIQVRIRIYEPQTRQMRQATVGADFVGD